MDISNEKIITDYPLPISIETTEIILNQLKNNICKIFMKNGGKGTGFFCKIPFPDMNHFLTVLITNSHVIDETYLNKEKKITISMNNDNTLKEIKLGNRITYSNKIYDITFIQIFQEKDNINEYLELNNNLNEEKFNEVYLGSSIYILQYPKGEKAAVSYGVLKNIDSHDNFIFSHLCCTEKGSSGSPIISLIDNKVIGIHIGSSKFCYNKGTFLKNSIREFFNKIKGKESTVNFKNYLPLKLKIKNNKKLFLKKKENNIFEKMKSNINIINNKKENNNISNENKIINDINSNQKKIEPYNNPFFFRSEYFINLNLSEEEKVYNNFYIQQILPELLNLIKKEIIIKYNRIYDNICCPLKNNSKNIMISLSIKDADLLKKSYIVKECKEKIEDIINKKEILKKIKKMIKEKIKNKNIYNEIIDISILYSENILDSACELIEEERYLNKKGEPFLYSDNTRIVSFKYSKDNPFKLAEFIHNSLLKILVNKLNKDNENIFINKEIKKDDEPRIIYDLEEPFTKLEASKLILDQLLLETVEILCHVELNRRNPQLYGFKSIYGITDIPLLEYQKDNLNNNE